MSKLDFINKVKGKESVVGRLEIKNQTDDSAELYIYGDIVSGQWAKWDNSDLCPDDIKDFLKGIEGKNKLNIYINSGGGSVFAGLAMYHQLKRNSAYKTVYVDGVAGSISSVLAFSGDELVVPIDAYLMIHKPWSWQIGNANDMRKMADDLDRIEEGILNVYKQNLKDDVDIEKVRELVNAETWMTGEEAEKYFNIKVGAESKAAACISDYFEKYMNTPKCLIPKKEPKGKAGNEPENNTDKEKLLLELDLIA